MNVQTKGPRQFTDHVLLYTQLFTQRNPSDYTAPARQETLTTCCYATATPIPVEVESNRNYRAYRVKTQTKNHGRKPQEDVTPTLLPKNRHDLIRPTHPLTPGDENPAVGSPSDSKMRLHDRAVIVTSKHPPCSLQIAESTNITKTGQAKPRTARHIYTCPNAVRPNLQKIHSKTSSARKQKQFSPRNNHNV